MENKYVPMKILGPDECPNCGCKALTLVDIDISVTKINNEGRLTETKDGCKIYIRCAKCGNKFDATKRGNYACINKKIFNPKLLINPLYQK